jgi:hypothetical protein
MQDCKPIIKIYEKLSRVSNLDDYKDENWCEEYSNDEYFLYVLCWAAWRLDRQMMVWQKVQRAYSTIGKKLNTYGEVDIKKLKSVYPLQWQQDWLQRLIKYLSERSLATDRFVLELRQMGYKKAHDLLQGIVETDQDKIVNCWLRDIVRLDAFPIDSRIRKLLKQYKIPDDPDLVMDCCVKNSIPIRDFARAVYENAEKLSP